jgi:hypothetical protein
MNFEDSLNNPYLSPETAQAAETISDASDQWSCRQQKRQQLIWMLALFAVSGFLTGILPEDTAWTAVLQVAMGIVFAVLVLGWCEYDRIERQSRRWPYFTFFMVIVPGPLIMVPTFLFATRGGKGFVAIAKAGAFFVLLIAVFVVAGVLGVMLTGAVLSS